MSMEERLRTFIIEELHWQGPREKLTEDFHLIRNRVIDSLGMARLVAFLDEEMNVEVDDDELVPDNFGTLRGIARLVESKRGS